MWEELFEGDGAPRFISLFLSWRLIDFCLARALLSSNGFFGASEIMAEPSFPPFNNYSVP